MPRRSPAQRAMISRRMESERRAGERAFLSSISLSAAQREQGEVTLRDLNLTAAAQVLRPGVRWWWGARQVGDRFGALCYLCDELIASWHRHYPMTRAAVRAVLDHRDREHTPGASTSGPIDSGRLPEREPPTGEVP